MDKRRTVANLFSLTSIQMLNYLLPLITMPYLVKTLGVSQYGLLSFGQATMQYFILITDYGFNIFGTQQIALHKNDEKKRNEIFNSILQAKFFLIICSMLILALMCLLIPKLRENILLYILLFGIVIGNALFPVWFFQGIEEMKAIGIINFLGKLVFTLGIFIFVQEETDIYFAAFLNSAGYLMMAVLSNFLIFKKYHINLVKVPFVEIKLQLQNAKHFFVANIATSFYTTTNIFFLGLVVGDTQVGYFNLANTVVRACAGLASPITQTFFPKIAVIAQTSKKSALKQIRAIFIVMTSLFFFGGCILFWGAPTILTAFFNNQFDHSILYIQIMAFLPLMVAWGNVFGVLIMSVFGYQKQLSQIYLIGGIFSMILMIILTLNFGGTGTAINAVFTEAIISVAMFVFTSRRNLTVIKKSRIEGY